MSDQEEEDPEKRECYQGHIIKINHLSDILEAPPTV